MGKFTTLATAISGLDAASRGLAVTGHNVSNVDTEGYTRQQQIQKDVAVRLGTDSAKLRQIRNKFLDITYRSENAKLGFYEIKYDTGLEIDHIMGELESDFRTQSVIKDMWRAINEISKNPESLETRAEFIQTSIAFLNKSQNVYERILNAQYNLNTEIINVTNKINELAQKIADANAKIAKNEVWGDEANDYRDERNAALDELSKLASLDFQERRDGSVTVFIEGKELVSVGAVNKLGFRYSSQNYSLVDPVFTTSTEILDYDPTNANAVPLFEFTGAVNSYNKNDLGKLKGMLVSRGPHPAVYADSIPSFFVLPTIMRRFDQLAHEIIITVNDSLAPNVPDGFGALIADANGPQGLDGTRGLEVFKRKVDRYTGIYYKEEDPTDIYTLYSLKNLEINPEILDSTGYSKLAFSKTGDVGNAEVALDMTANWNAAIEPLYSDLIVTTATEISEAKSYVDSETDLVIQIDNRRKQISGVSLDEEMANMMIYQHAFNASARLVNVIDSMIDKIINGTGRAGR